MFWFDFVRLKKKGPKMAVALKGSSHLEGVAAGKKESKHFQSLQVTSRVLAKQKKTAVY